MVLYYVSSERVKENGFKVILQTSFEQCFQKWERWWERCIAVQGGNFGGNNIQ
jgi:hypothetical protein